MLVGEFVVGTKEREKDMGEAGLSDAGRADDEDNCGLEIALRGGASCILLEGFAVAAPGPEVGFSDGEVGLTITETDTDCVEVVALALGFGGTVLVGARDAGLFLLAVFSRLRLGTAPGFPMSAGKAVEVSHETETLLAFELEIALEVEAVGCWSTLELVDEVGHSVPLIEGKRNKGLSSVGGDGYVVGEAVVTCFHGDTRQNVKFCLGSDG